MFTGLKEVDESETPERVRKGWGKLWAIVE